jgi:hypothetical protein
MNMKALLVCRLYDYIALMQFGGGLATSDCGQNFTFTGCRIQGNSASQYGGGVYVQRLSGALLFDKTVLDGNNANQVARMQKPYYTFRTLHFCTTKHHISGPSLYPCPILPP